MGPDIHYEAAKDPIVIRRRHMRILADVVLNALFLMIFLLGLWVFWTGIPHLKLGIPWTSLVVPFLIMLLGVIPLPWLMWVFYHNLLEGEIAIGSEHLRTVRKGRVLREIVFDGGPSSEVFFDEGKPDGRLDDVAFIKFSRGWWFTISVSVDEYSQEDLFKIWPMVRAVVSKGGLRAGKRLRKLTEIEDG